MAMVAHQRRIVARHQPHPYEANELHEQIVGEVVVPRRDRPTRPAPEEALACAAAFQEDRKSVVEGKSVSERVDIDGGRVITKKKEQMHKDTTRKREKSE